MKTASKRPSCVSGISFLVGDRALPSAKGASNDGAQSSDEATDPRAAGRCRGLTPAQCETPSRDLAGLPEEITETSNKRN